MTPFNLHRAQQKADWQYVDPAERTYWQRLAATSHGIITPGNIITTGGALLVIAGLIRLTNQADWTAVCLIVVGRLGDIIDGMAAAWTNTKSPLGGILDATTDKLLVFIAVICLAVSGLIPAFLLALIALQAGFNSAVSLIGYIHKVIIHPSKEGKWAMALSWTIIAGFVLHAVTHQRWDVVSIIIVIPFVWFSIISSRHYFNELKRIIHHARRR